MKAIAFEPSSKRRKGFPSETCVKSGHRIVRGDKELSEKLGRNDLLPVRVRTQVSRIAACVAAGMTAQFAIITFRGRKKR